MTTGTGASIRDRLMVEHDRLLAKIAKWRLATNIYRWSNVVLFMTCKMFVPTGALIIAANMVSIVFGKPLIGDIASAAIAIAVTFLASLEAMLNPSSKKRLAFTLNNELNSIENKLNIARISSDDEALEKMLVWADGEVKRLLNHYADNGY